MKMRHDSWHPASISSTPTSCGAAKIRAQKCCLYRHQWINVAQAAVQDWGRVGRGGGRSRGEGDVVDANSKAEPLQRWKCALKSEKNQKGTMGLLTSWSLVSRPHRQRRARRWRVLQAERTRGFWALLNFLGCLKRTCNLMQRQHEWAMGQPVQRWGLSLSSKWLFLLRLLIQGSWKAAGSPQL